jgi:UPF0755 protein
MTWILRSVAAGFLILVLVGGVVGVIGYRHYTRARAERLAELKKKAEDTKVTFIEGWTVADIAGALEKQGLGKAADFIAAAKTDIPKDSPYINIPAHQSLEGYLFPDTYRFAKTSTPDIIIQKILDNFSDRVATLGVPVSGPDEPYQIAGYENLKLNGQRGLTFHQIITLASIIEKESGSNTGPEAAARERKIISGIFYNRLMIGQALESDATVNYVSGKDNPSSTNADLQINSPYNTYRYAGLPPGPICNPSLSSIDAALHPEVTDYYYFLHKQPSGEVVYSKTFEEHKKNKALYLK